MAGVVESLSFSTGHDFSKTPVDQIEFIAGLGVKGDTHAGETVQHLSRIRKDPNQPNLRQVHLIHAELLDDLRAKGFDISAGDIGENILTRDIDLLALAPGAVLRIGSEVELEITGLRNPCAQLDRFQSGLMHAVLEKAEDGRLIRKSGVMAIVLRGGIATGGDEISLVDQGNTGRELKPV